MKQFFILPFLLITCWLLSMDHKQDIKQGNVIIEIENGKIATVTDDEFVQDHPKRSKCLIIIPAIVITSAIAAGTALTIHFTE